jgi:hypothetical protein
MDPAERIPRQSSERRSVGEPDLAKGEGMGVREMIQVLTAPRPAFRPTAGRVRGDASHRSTTLPRAATPHQSAVAGRLKAHVGDTRRLDGRREAGRPVSHLHGDTGAPGRALGFLSARVSRPAVAVQPLPSEHERGAGPSPELTRWWPLPSGANARSVPRHPVARCRAIRSLVPVGNAGCVPWTAAPPLSERYATALGMHRRVVDPRGFEPLTFWLPARRSTS